MSFSFEIDSRTVWDPALRVGQIYSRYAHVLEGIFGIDAGFTYITNDTVSVDLGHFETFILALVNDLSRSSHRILQAQLRTIVLPGIVMLKRAGKTLEFADSDDLAAEMELLDRDMPQ